jgi:hypothetical protein
MILIVTTSQAKLILISVTIVGKLEEATGIVYLHRSHSLLAAPGSVRKLFLYLFINTHTYKQQYSVSLVQSGTRPLCTRAKLRPPVTPSSGLF